MRLRITSAEDIGERRRLGSSLELPFLVLMM